MATLDLNKLRETLAANAAQNATRPTDPQKRVVVDREGRILLGDDATRRDAGPTSEVPQSLFAAVFFSRAATDRDAQDREIARTKLPSNTRVIDQDGIAAYVFSVIDEFGESFEFCVYHDGCEYQSKLVSPALEREFGVGKAHVFADGRLCLRPPTGGADSLEEAYAKSVLWANGFTVLRRTGVFPWPSH